MHHAFLAILSVITTLSHATPTSLQSRDISATQLTEFGFWVQYAAATYCPYNFAPTSIGSKIACLDNNCPQVEADDATIFYTFGNTTITDTAGFVAVDHTKKALILAFRGSYSLRNWLVDIEFELIDPGLCEGCLADLGFWNSWILVRDDVLQVIKDAVSNHSDYELLVVGHSLGAAIATLVAADLRSRGYPSLPLYAYASPRVGNPKMASYITAQGNNYRFTHINDPVPKMPLLIQGYVHVSPEYYITSGNNITVTTSDVEVLEGAINLNGNTGTGLVDLSKVPAHHWYFERADGCLSGETPL
ncbi:hypothetical protein N7495_005258 [Penicillium taxi]|uniref:uncharacterized protein n=1 Tax=Penicillium taxi TaxID=168475 RepID=UPI0025453733|nr:uncharacterized protein N7495_005258 [Penicillium taxi]KAJ5893567.1 hypothetical protein N7495_005258 [Penicillium taxi]